MTPLHLYCALQWHYITTFHRDHTHCRYGDTYIVKPASALHLAETHARLLDESFAVGSLWDPLAGQDAAGSPQDSVPEVSTDPDELFIASNRYPYQGWETFRAKCAHETNEDALRKVFYEGQCQKWNQTAIVRLAAI